MFWSDFKKNLSSVQFENLVTKGTSKIRFKPNWPKTRCYLIIPLIQIFLNSLIFLPQICITAAFQGVTCRCRGHPAAGHTRRRRLADASSIMSFTPRPRRNHPVGKSQTRLAHTLYPHNSCFPPPSPPSHDTEMVKKPRQINS